MRLPAVGWLALNVRDGPNGATGPTDVWWIVDELQRCPTRAEGDRLILEFPDHRGEPRPAATFTMERDGSLRLTGLGAPDRVPAPFFADLRWRRMRPPTTFEELVSLERERWSRRDGFLRLDEHWTENVAASLVRVFAGSGAVLIGTLTLRDLPAEEVADLARLSTGSPVWSDFAVGIQMGLAQHPNSPLPALETLWRESRDPGVWRVAARHPRAPAGWSEEWSDRVRSGSQALRRAAVQDPDTPEDFRESLLRSCDPGERRVLAAAAGLPPSAYETLARDFRAEVGVLLASNHDLSPPAFHALADSGNLAVLTALLWGPCSVPAHRLATWNGLLREVHFAELAKVAAHPDMSAAALHALAQVVDAGVRQCVAANPRTGEDVLAGLAADAVRPVAAAARTALRLRFPKTWEHLEPTLAPLEELGPDASLSGQCLDLVRRGNAVQLAEMLRALAGRPERSLLPLMLEPAGLRDCRPELMGMLLDAVEDEKLRPLVLLSLAKLAADNAAWREYFANQKVFAGEAGGKACKLAVLFSTPAVLRMAIGAGGDIDFADEEGLTLLNHAILGGNSAAALVLLDAGASVELRDRRGRTALFYAFATLDLPVLKRLDKDGQYRGVTRLFPRRYMPQERSSLAGLWRVTGPKGKRERFARFREDGTGTMGDSDRIRPFAWKGAGKNGAEIYLMGEYVWTRFRRGDVETRSTDTFGFDHEKPVRVTLSIDGTGIVLKHWDGRTEQMVRWNPLATDLAAHGTNAFLPLEE